MTDPSRSRPRTVLYLAGSDATAREGAATLEAALPGQNRTVYPLSTVSAGHPGRWVADVDCVVFAETPTTTAGASLLEVGEACESTPLVLFTDASYPPTAAHATDGIDGYVRQGTDDAVAHLADEIEWICRSAADAASLTEASRLRAAFERLPEPALRYERVDGRSVVRAVTDSLVETFDVDRETIVGTPIHGDETVVPPGLEGQRETLGVAVQSDERCEWRSRCATAAGVGEFRLDVVPLSLAESDHAGGLVVYSDVTETCRETRELVAAHARLETIADGLETDVATALNVASGYLEAAADTGAQEHFETVDDAQERLRAAVDRLTAIARRDSLVETEPVAIHNIARRAWAPLETGDARLVTPGGDDRILEADKTRLQELFDRLFRTILDDGRLEGETASGRAVTVGATDDGFFVGDDADHTTDGDGGLETALVAQPLATADGTGADSGPVERIADAHGWTVASTSDGEQTTVVFSGVEDVKLE